MRAELRIVHRSVAFVALVLLPGLAAPAAAGGGEISVLAFTRTEGFSHGSIADGVGMLTTLSQDFGFSLTTTDQTDLFTPKGLATFDVVVWLSTTGDVLDPPEEVAFEGFIQRGGGYVGIHAAADCEYGWPWYGDLLGGGAWFDSHPAIQDALLVVENPGEPLAGGWEDQTVFTDEWYNFRENPRPFVDVVQTLDEESYDPGPGAMGDDHPIAWRHEYDGGRVFYTALGHRAQTFADPRFRAQILAAIRWAATGLGIKGQTAPAP